MRGTDILQRTHGVRTPARSHNEPEVEDGRRNLAARLRLARRTRGLTLRELALQAECSESLLSKLENGRASPSLALVHRLVLALGINTSWLFEEAEPDEAVIYRAGRRPSIALAPDRHGEGVTLERIVPYELGHLLQCNIHHLEVGGRSGDAIVHEGEEVGYVLEGRVELLVDGVAYALAVGDAFCFRSRRPHRYRNIGDEPASILWTCTPPTF